MRKIILTGLMAAAALPVAAPAVAGTSPGELRRDRQDVREERRELRDAQRHGDYSDVREQREDLRDAKRELREDRRDRRDRYAAPYRGWRYSTLRPGTQLRPVFYGQRYRITNYSRYKLRPVAPNRQWIRYGDDLVLVNTRTGRVIQVLRDRYWG